MLVAFFSTGRPEDISLSPTKLTQNLNDWNLKNGREYQENDSVGFYLPGSILNSGICDLKSPKKIGEFFGSSPSRTVAPHVAKELVCLQHIAKVSRQCSWDQRQTSYLAQTEELQWKISLPSWIPCKKLNCQLVSRYFMVFPFVAKDYSGLNYPSSRP